MDTDAKHPRTSDSADPLLEARRKRRGRPGRGEEYRRLGTASSRRWTDLKLPTQPPQCGPAVGLLAFQGREDVNGIMRETPD